MGPVRLQYVVSYSSQDNKYPAENLLHKSGLSLGKGWHSSPSDKSGLLEAEFQLEKASFIHNVDIGNCGSSTIEVLVGRSSWPRNKEYTSLLPAISMMTYSESKSGINRISVRMFTSDNLNHEALTLKWDRVRVICSQPYRKDMPFGIAFLRLGNKEADVRPSTLLSNNNSLKDTIKKAFTKKINVNLMKSFAANIDNEKSTKSSSSPLRLSRGQMMCDAARKVKTRPPTPELMEDTSIFETDILLFLTSRGSERFADSIHECLLEYEELNGADMNSGHAQLFQCLYKNVFREEGGSFEGFSASISTNSFYSSVSPNANKRKELDSDDDSASFDVDFDLPHLNGRSQKRHSEGENGHSLHNGIRDFTAAGPSSFDKSKKRRYDVSKYTPKFVPLISLDDDAKPCQNNSSPLSSVYNEEDFIQFDGSKPGTSKEVAYVDCPICSEPFHVDDIERHAATCDKYPSEDSENDDEEVVERSVIPATSNCHSEKYLECPVCGNMFQKTILPLHANICIENCLA